MKKICIRSNINTLVNIYPRFTQEISDVGTARVFSLPMARFIFHIQSSLIRAVREYLCNTSGVRNMCLPTYRSIYIFISRILIYSDTKVRSPLWKGCWSDNTQTKEKVNAVRLMERRKIHMRNQPQKRNRLSRLRIRLAAQPRMLFAGSWNNVSHSCDSQRTLTQLCELRTKSITLWNQSTSYLS